MDHAGLHLSGCCITPSTKERKLVESKLLAKPNPSTTANSPNENDDVIEGNRICHGLITGDRVYDIDNRTTTSIPCPDLTLEGRSSLANKVVLGLVSLVLVEVLGDELGALGAG